MSGSGDCQIETNATLSGAEKLGRIGGDFMGICKVAESKTRGFARIKEDSVPSLFAVVLALLRHVFACAQAQAIRAENTIRGNGSAKARTRCSNAPHTALLGTNPLKVLADLRETPPAPKPFDGQEDNTRLNCGS
jgi:hypothetical protein